MNTHDITTCKENHGVLTDVRLEDWKVGANSMIPYEVRLSSGNWYDFAPPGEWQKNLITGVDVKACVSFTDTSDTETQLNKFLYEGALSDYKIQRCIELGYLQSVTGMVINLEAVKNNPRNFSFNFSDRALAKLSNTMPEGNWLWKVADVHRKIGLVAENRWPAPWKYTWDSYYEPVPQDVQDECGEFLKMFSVAYEFFDVTRENLIYHLKHVPISIVLPGHNVVGIRCTKDIVDYFDSYEPFFKQLVGLPQVAMKLVITIKPDDMPAELLRIFRIEGKPEVYAILNGKRYWVSPYEIFTDGRGKLWPDVNPADVSQIKPEEAAKYPLVGLFGNASIVDYVRFLFIK